jgi:hypothetical protein
MPRTRRHKADRGRCISRAARDKRDLGGDRCDTAPDARRQHMVLNQGSWSKLVRTLLIMASASEEPIAAAQATRHTHA